MPRKRLFPKVVASVQLGAGSAAHRELPAAPWLSRGVAELWPWGPPACGSSSPARVSRTGQGHGACPRQPPPRCTHGRSIVDKGPLLGGVVVLLGAPGPWESGCDKHSDQLQWDRHTGAFQCGDRNSLLRLSSISFFFPALLRLFKSKMRSWKLSSWMSGARVPNEHLKILLLTI